MSTPASRRPTRGTTHPPSASRSASQSSRAPERSSFCVEPKSEYLRNALEARRTKDSPADTRPIPHRTTSSFSSSATPSAAASTDPWLEQAASEDDIPYMAPMRRGRRPSESGLPRVPTQREQQTEIEALKNDMFNRNLQLELIKKQNNELKDKLEAANQRVEALERLEDKNVDLREHNDRLTLKLQNMEDELLDLQEQNRDVLQIQDETVAEIEKHHASLDEAAGIILQLETQKAELQEALEALKTQTTNNQTPVNGTQQYQDAYDGQPKDRQPLRVYSIDESRPSTSHFDSDYYSQPDSPQVKVQRSNDLQPYSDRAKAFMDMNVNSKKSLRDLKQRTSNLSAKSPKLRSLEPAPKVPSIPEVFNTAYQDEQSSQSTAWVPDQQQNEPIPPQPLSLNTTPYSSSKDNALAPRTPTSATQQEGLRGLFREYRTVERASRPSSSYQSPTESKSSRRSRTTRPAPVPPQRDSSRIAQTPSSERLIHSSSEGLGTETAPSEYLDTSLSPPPVDNEDLMSIDSQRWWKDVRGVCGRRDLPTDGTNWAEGISALASVPKPRRAPTDMERDFFFNGAEDEDQFMKRAHSYMPKRK